MNFLFFLAVIAVLVGYAIGWQVVGAGSPRPLTGRGNRAPTDDAAPSRPILADYGPAPEFSLTERSGEIFSKSKLLGKPWIANFIFTSCAPVHRVTRAIASLCKKCTIRSQVFIPCSQTA